MSNFAKMLEQYAVVLKKMPPARRKASEVLFRKAVATLDEDGLTAMLFMLATLADEPKNQKLFDYLVITYAQLLGCVGELSELPSIHRKVDDLSWQDLLKNRVPVLLNWRELEGRQQDKLIVALYVEAGQPKSVEDHKPVPTTQITNCLRRNELGVSGPTAGLREMIPDYIAIVQDGVGRAGCTWKLTENGIQEAQRLIREKNLNVGTANVARS